MPKPILFAIRTIAIVLCLYLPFVICWLTVVHANDQKLLPVAPGSSIWLVVKDRTVQWQASAAVTVGLLVTLIWLGSKGRSRLIAAILIALVISIPSAGAIYLLASIGNTMRGI
jgi:hypothetical protein